MPELWTIPHGKNVTVFTDEDRLELIRARAGPEAERWVRELAAQDAYEKAHAESDMGYYEASLESSHSTLQDVVGDLGVIVNQLLSPRGPTKAAISRQLEELRRNINKNL